MIARESRKTSISLKFQGISPGLVATELMVSYSTYSEEALASFPTLDPEDVATAAVYILSCPPHVVVSVIASLYFVNNSTNISLKKKILSTRN